MEEKHGKWVIVFSRLGPLGKMNIIVSCASFQDAEEKMDAFIQATLDEKHFFRIKSSDTGRSTAFRIGDIFEAHVEFFGNMIHCELEPEHPMRFPMKFSKYGPMPDMRRAESGEE